MIPCHILEGGNVMGGLNYINLNDEQGVYRSSFVYDLLLFVFIDFGLKLSKL